MDTAETPLAPGPAGLRPDEVAARVAAGKTNRSAPAPGRSLGEILWRNTFTWLNFILLVLGTASLATGSAPDATFLIIAVINTAVGSVQEVRAKRALDALAVINAPKVRAVRDGASQVIEVEEVVLDDVLDLGPGDQVVADAIVEAGQAEVDESLATGESDPVLKGPGDRLLSGSWVVSGSVQSRVTAVGADSYAGRLASEARRFSLTGSELMGGINRILRWLTVAMVIIGPILFLRQLGVQPWRPAVRSAVAGLVGMVPEGLVLLTTLAFLTAAMRLGRRGVLVQELPAVEGLARVDALCTDKTGTLTEGRVEWGQLITPEGVAGGGDPRRAGRPGGRPTAERHPASRARGCRHRPGLATYPAGALQLPAQVERGQLRGAGHVGAGRPRGGRRRRPGLGCGDVSARWHRRALGSWSWPGADSRWATPSCRPTST